MWFEVKICLNVDICEQIIELMIALGANGVSIEGDGFQQSIASHDTSSSEEELPDQELDSGLGWFMLSTFFPEGGKAEAFVTDLSESMKNNDYLKFLADKISITQVDEKCWETEWKKYYHRVKPGSRIVILPAWEEYQPLDDEKVLLMDPGMAFGSGTHESTAMCIRSLEKIVSGGEQVADIGCGSAILGLTALLLGAKYVDGVEIDDVAVKVAQENIALNGKAESFSLVQGDGAMSLPGLYYDVVIANIIASVIKDNLISIRSKLAPNGICVFSGIIASKWPDLETEMIKNGYLIQSVFQEKEWLAVEASIL